MMEEQIAQENVRRVVLTSSYVRLPNQNMPAVQIANRAV